MSDAVTHSKGAKTRQRLLDAAEALFALKGYEGASLRDVAARSGMRESGIYHYFSGKEALYAEVLDRALSPMVRAMEERLGDGSPETSAGILADIVTDLYVRHPAIAPLFQQAMAGAGAGQAPDAIQAWLSRLLDLGRALHAMPEGDEVSVARSAVRMAALFNLSNGYFLSQTIFRQFGAGEPVDELNVSEQKRLLRQFIWLLDFESI